MQTYLTQDFFFLSRSQSHASSAMLRYASGHLKTPHPPRPPRPPLRPPPPRAPPPASRCVSCGSTRRRNPAPAAVPRTSRRRPTTARAAGSAKRAGRPATATVRATTAGTAPGEPGPSSSETRDAPLPPAAAPRRGATDTLAKSRTSRLYRQSKTKTNLIMNGKDVGIYTYI